VSAQAAPCSWALVVLLHAAQASTLAPGGRETLDRARQEARAIGLESPDLERFVVDDIRKAGAPGP
jgi:hypothetical protein